MVPVFFAIYWFRISMSYARTSPRGRTSSTTEINKNRGKYNKNGWH